MSATTFSAASQFKQGQFVTALGQTAIAVGWKRGNLGKVVVVEFTGGSMKGRTMGIGPSLIKHRAARSRKGRDGNGPLRLIDKQ
jgi:hypothetical protein